MLTFPHDELRSAVMRIFTAAGATAEAARTVADHLVDANLFGHDSHGVGMVPSYVNGIRRGYLDPRAEGRIVQDSGAVVVYDGARGLGQVVAKRATELGIERARAHGIALVGLRNAFHIGRIGSYGELAAAAGMISIHFVNVVGHDAVVAPFGGIDARFSTNPICCAVPTAPGQEPIILDFATSIVALGKVRVVRNKGDTLPDGLVIDAAGRPSTDPDVMFQQPKGALRTFGLHKGSGLAMMCELLAGALTGGGTLATTPQLEGLVINNMFAVVVDPARLRPTDALQAEVAAVVDWVKASPAADPASPVLVAGEPERRTRADRQARGVPVDEETWRQIRAAARELDVALG